MMASRVIPSRMSSETNGVRTVPLRTRKTFSPLPSETNPSLVSSIASSYPSWTASTFARTLFTYAPANLPVGGRALSDTRAQELTHTLRPVSYTHLRAHETRHDLVCRLLLEKKNNDPTSYHYKHH